MRLRGRRGAARRGVAGPSASGGTIRRKVSATVLAAYDARQLAGENDARQLARVSSLQKRTCRASHFR